MMDETIWRADEALTEMVELSRSGKTSCAELRRGLEASKALSAKLDVYQATSASVLAVRESHGDGGAGVLAQAAGLPRRAAAAQVKTAERLQSMPDVQQAVETGQVSFANAKALADAADETSADAIAEDSELLAKAASLAPEQLAREAGQWAAKRRNDGGEADFRRLRRRRRLSIAGGGTIPQSVLDEHMSNAKITGIVFSDKGVPLWQGHTKQVATDAQKRALTALYGGCGGCGERPVLCQAHHIRPVSQGGPTDITNMMLICWSCHQKVHRHGWRAVRDGRGLYTIEPPDRVHYGPALAPDLLPGHAPDSLSVPSHERPGTANMDDTARSEPPEAHAGPSGPAAARKALREASGYQVGPSPPRPDALRLWSDSPMLLFNLD